MTEPNICPKCLYHGPKANGSCMHCDDMVSQNTGAHCDHCGRRVSDPLDLLPAGGGKWLCLRCDYDMAVHDGMEPFGGGQGRTALQVRDGGMFLFVYAMVAVLAALMAIIFYRILA